jgi:hypothetical protein
MPAGRRKGQRCDFAAEREVVEHDSAGHVCKDGLSVFVDGEQKVSARVQCQAGDVSPVRKRKGVCFGPARLLARGRHSRLPHILHEVKHSDAVADRREQTCAVGREEQVAPAVDGAQQVGELFS